MAQFYTPRRRQADKKQLVVTIESLDPFGQGVAHNEGKTYFVTDALPTEKVEIQIVEDKKQYAKAKIICRSNDSPQRVKPMCIHFGSCGGCQQQHVSSALQRSSKLSALINLIEREIDVLVVPGEIIYANEYGYRRRARLSLRYDVKNKQLQMGFRQKSSNEIISINQCPVLCKELEILLAPLHQCLSQLAIVEKLGHVELVFADNNPIIILRHLSPIEESDNHILCSFAEKYHVSIYLAFNDGKLKKLIGIESWYVINKLKLSFDPQDFIQVNAEINQKMVNQALDWLALCAEDRVLDLFCGMGNFTLPIALQAGYVIGVEGVARLVVKGQENARNNGLANIGFFHENLEGDISQQDWAKQGFNKILLDPARAGAAIVMAQIINLSPSHIVYVSCNPATLARDSKVLIKAGYALAQVRMLDMFPHTGHLESMVLFIKDK